VLDADGGLGERGHDGVDREAGPLAGVGDVEGGIEIVAEVEIDAAQVAGWSSSEEVEKPRGFVEEEEVFDAGGVEVRGCFVMEFFLAVRLVPILPVIDTKLLWQETYGDLSASELTMLRIRDDQRFPSSAGG
jgi:hypothetical protein